MSLTLFNYGVTHVKIIDYTRLAVGQLASKMGRNCLGLDSQAQSYFISVHCHLDVTRSNSAIICDLLDEIPS